jgi:ribonuclease P protein subunit POP4
MEEKYAMEYIGLRVNIVRSPDKSKIGLSGNVVDETARTFIIEVKGGRTVRIPKAGSVFRFRTPSGDIDVEGSRICRRPEDRAKG